MVGNSYFLLGQVFQTKFNLLLGSPVVNGSRDVGVR